jgi:hypothetical protein
MERSNTALKNNLEPLFEIELQYKEALEAVTSPEGRIGQYLGSGGGTIKGQKLNGTIRWDLYEIVGETRCQTNFAGIIETDDGARIQFDAKGFGMVPDRSKPNKWYMVNAIQFDSEDRRYDWLNMVLALWDGEFDMETYRHFYQVYTRAGDRS